MAVLASLRNSPSQLARNSASVALSLVLTSVLSAGQALAVVVLLGESEKTDAFFAAYACYAPLALWATSLRVSLVPLIGLAPTPEQLRRRAAELVSRTLLLGCLLALALAAAAPLLATALTTGMSEAGWRTTVIALLILAPGVLLHFVGASLSGALAAESRFYASAVIYPVASFVALATAIALLPQIGIIGAPIALLGGAGMLALAHVAYGRRIGLMLRIRWRWLRVQEQRAVVIPLLAGAALLMAQQACVAISLAALPARPGAITVYTLAYFVVALMMNLSFSALSFVLAPRLVRERERVGLSAAEHQLYIAARYGFFLLTPLVATVLLFGEPMVEALLSPFMSVDDLGLFHDVLSVFMGIALPYGLFLICGMIVLALGQWLSALYVSLAAVVIHAAIVLPLAGSSPVWVAVGHVLALAVTSALLLGVTFGRRFSTAIGQVFVAAGPVIAAGLVFLPLRLAVEDPTALEGLSAALGGTVIYLVVVLMVLSEMRGVLLPSFIHGLRWQTGRTRPPDDANQGAKKE